MERRSLPEELVEQILYRVPIKSVARWRSTSKQWNALLKSKRFLKTHSTYAARLRLFPEATTHSLRIRKTYVLWDITGYSIHEDFRPCSVREQIESGIKKEGYYGELSIWVYGAEDAWSSELDSIFWDSGFETYRYKENKEEVERDPKFARLRKVLEDNSFFVVSAHPETLVIEDTKPVHSETA